MLVNFYRFLGRYIPGCALKPFFWKRAKGGKEIPERRYERFGQPSLLRPKGFLVWVHGASVGELASARSVIKRLLDYHPNIYILITSGTVTSAEFVKPWLNERCFHQFVPYDLQGPVQGFLDHWKPDLTLWVESELWPNLIQGIKSQKKPAYLLNGRMSYRSFRLWKKTGTGIKDILSTFSIIFAQSSEQRERFQILGAPSVEVLGHLKLVSTPLDVNKTVQQSFLQYVQGRTWFMAASTHPHEEKILFEAFHVLKRNHPNLMMVVAPRHISRAKDILQEAQLANLTACLHSQGDEKPAKAQIYILDCIGLLGSFYALHPLVIIGGTFVPIGGHNFVEAFQLGALPLVGPYMHNQLELISFFQEANCLVQVKDKQVLKNQLDYYLNHPLAAQKKIQQAEKILCHHKGLLDQLISYLTVSFPHDAQSA